MRALRRVLLVAIGALLLTMAVAATATATATVSPAAIQTTQYVWPQPPAWVGVVPSVTWVPRSTAYVWGQPPSWIPIAG